jgi:formate/nitrite transporter FocA (FNT family)
LSDFHPTATSSKAKRSVGGTLATSMLAGQSIGATIAAIANISGLMPSRLLAVVAALFTCAGALAR